MVFQPPQPAPTEEGRRIREAIAKLDRTSSPRKNATKVTLAAPIMELPMCVACADAIRNARTVEPIFYMEPGEDARLTAWRYIGRREPGYPVRYT